MYFGEEGIASHLVNTDIIAETSRADVRLV